MSKYIQKPAVIEATRWFKNGDHPKDGRGGEGKVVRYYLNPKKMETVVFECCNMPMHDHGWIGPTASPKSYGYGFTVCPGDWVIEDMEEAKNGGEIAYYVIPNYIFEQHYESKNVVKREMGNFKEMDYFWL